MNAPQTPSGSGSSVAAEASPGPAAEDHDATRILPGPAAPHVGSGQTTHAPRVARPTPPSSIPGSALPDHGETLPPAPAGAAAPLRQVGRYQILGRLGRGGMATVYRAHDPSIGRDVAIKFLHASLCEDDDCRTRFLREGRAAGGLSHPNIVVVHDVGEIAGRPYMAMELIEGTPLSESLEASKKLPVRAAVVIGMQLARALDYAHSRGIVHRDIKPGNIMLLRDGHSIKVTDFGIAHMEDGNSEQRTQVGAVMGTPQYMSPEQARGERLDGRSDLFSTGIVLYQMLAGARPFRGDSMVSLATEITTADPPALRQVRPEVPASLRRIVERCLVKKPARRFQSGRELADALQKVLAAIDEEAQENEKPRIVPLRIKWALTMGLIVAIVMGLTATVITRRQYVAMMDQMSQYGASLARFIAAQNAAAVLGDEWEAVDVALQEMMQTRNFERIDVVDRAGTVRATSVAGQADAPYRPVGTEHLGTVDGARVVRYVVAGESILGFEVPVLFQGKEVGRVALGIPEKPLSQLARLSIVLMTILALVTVVAVAMAMYLVANWFAKPIRLASEAMGEIAKGRYDHRIAEDRNDEFGELFRDFDRMAEALQQRLGEPQPEQAAPATMAAPQKG